MRIVYRLEDTDGNGPFFYRNGQARFDSNIKFDDNGIYGFTDKTRFREKSYEGFYKNPNFLLYKITVSEVLSEHNGQAVFLEASILSKELVIKDCFGDGMKIIKHGNHETLTKPKYFHCGRCGCEFEADISEYKAASQIAYIHDGISAECKCPLCGRTAYAYE